MSELNGETGGVDRIDCGELVDMAAELALGVLTGRERAAALAHLDGCPACSEYVRQLTATGEELVQLLPPREPPAGFESRVLDRLGLPVPGPGAQSYGPQAAVLRAHRKGTSRRSLRRQSRWPAKRRTLLAAAAVLAVLAGGLGGWEVRSATTSAPAPVAAASSLRSGTLLTAGHQNAGEVFLFTGRRQWMYADVYMDNAKTTTVICQLETADGKIATVGSFRLTDGSGYWGGPWPSGAAVTSARLVTPDGTVLASATFGR